MRQGLWSGPWKTPFFFNTTRTPFLKNKQMPKASVGKRYQIHLKIQTPFFKNPDRNPHHNVIRAKAKRIPSKAIQVR